MSAVAESLVKEKTATKAAESATDMITDVAANIEGMSEQQVLAEIPEITEANDQNNFMLGGLLARVRDEMWWQDKGYKQFFACTEELFGIKPRKARYLVEIYTNLVASGVKWNQVKVLGWTKLSRVSAILTKENVKDVVSHCKGLTTIQVEEYVKSLKGGKSTTEAAKDSPTAAVTTMTFKLHEDQKEIVRIALDAEKQASGTEYDTVALEHICTQYTEGTTGKPTITVADIKALGLEKACELLGDAFPDADITVSV